MSKLFMGEIQGNPEAMRQARIQKIKAETEHVRGSTDDVLSESRAAQELMVERLKTDKKRSAERLDRGARMQIDSRVALLGVLAASLVTTVETSVLSHYGDKSENESRSLLIEEGIALREQIHLLEDELKITQGDVNELETFYKLKVDPQELVPSRQDLLKVDDSETDNQRLKDFVNGLDVRESVGDVVFYQAASQAEYFFVDLNVSGKESNDVKISLTGAASKVREDGSVGFDQQLLDGMVIWRGASKDLDSAEVKKEVTTKLAIIIKDHLATERQEL